MSMPQNSTQSSRARPLASPRFLSVFRGALALVVLAVAAGDARLACAQGNDLPVGRIEGDDFAVSGEAPRIRDNGVTYTSLSSGAQVTVRSGSARIELSRGGAIGICGPARFSLVRAGSSLTLALDYGRVRARVDASENLHIYTPMVQASAIPNAGRTGDISVGLEENGKMCVHPGGGALRLEPQFGGDSIVVPQGMEATLQEGRLAALAEGGQACGCDALTSKRKVSGPDTGPQARVALPPASAAPEPDAAEKKSPPASAPPVPFQQPIWQVYMPPLVYDNTAPGGDPAAAHASSMPPPSPETVLLFRQVYAEPVIRLFGEVEEPPAKSAKTATEPAKPAATEPAAEKKPSFAARIGNFFRRLFGGKSKPKDQGPPAQNAAA